MIPRLPRAARDGPRLLARRRRPRLRRRPRGRCARDLDRGVRRRAARTSRANLPQILAPWQAWLDSLGLSQVDLVGAGRGRLGEPRPDRRRSSSRRSSQIAVASLGVLGTMLHRVLPVDLHGRRPRPDPGVPVPPRAAVLLPRRPGSCRRRSSRSFGGFLRGQAVMGLVYFADRLRHERAARPAAARRSPRSRRAPPDDPVLRPVRLVGAAGHRRARCSSPSRSSRRSS